MIGAGLGLPPAPRVEQKSLGCSPLWASVAIGCRMAKTVIVQLTDDIDGGDADETVAFALDNKSYEIDVSKKNANALRKVLAPYIERARSGGRQSASGRARRSPSSASGPTMFSQLDEKAKQRFRKWAGMPNARRIADSRVQGWIDAGRP